MRVTTMFFCRHCSNGLAGQPTEAAMLTRKGYPSGLNFGLSTGDSNEYSSGSFGGRIAFLWSMCLRRSSSSLSPGAGDFARESASLANHVSLGSLLRPFFVLGPSRGRGDVQRRILDRIRARAHAKKQEARADASSAVRSSINRRSAEDLRPIDRQRDRHEPNVRERQQTRITEPSVQQYGERCRP